MYSSKFNALTTVLAVGLLAACASPPAAAKAKRIDDTHWTGVQRVIAVGDIHGDYAQYIRVLTDAGLIDERGRWSGGDTHLVQTGDVPDRGPDTRRILDHLEGLKKEARRKGGAVHTLIGNHEAMNVYGDLRYVTPGEFEAFQDRNSERLWQAQWEHHLRNLEANDPEAFAQMDLAAFRVEWEQQYPLGWVEHRNAWMPGGEYGKLVMDNPVVLKIDDTLFLHGGLSAKYCQLSLEDITEQVHEGMANFDYANPGIVEDEFGPLWYRGLASDSEAVRGPMVDAILERYGAKRIVVGHTVTQGIVWPRFDGKVILNDVGISAYYGGYEAFLELGPEGPVAHYGKRTVPIPTENEARLDYLRAVVALQPTNGALQSRLQRMLVQAQRSPQPGPDEAAAEHAPEQAPDEAAEQAPDEAAEQAPAEGEGDAEAAAAAQREAWLSPDNCR